LIILIYIIRKIPSKIMKIIGNLILIKNINE